MKILAIVAVFAVTLVGGANLQPAKASAQINEQGVYVGVWDPNRCEPRQWFRADNQQCIDKTGAAATVKTKWDPNGCEPARWFRADNFECIDKTPAQAAPAPTPVQAPQPVEKPQPVQTPAPVQETPTPAPAAPTVAAPVQVAGSGCEWARDRLAANGIASGDIPAAMAIMQKESSCNPKATNPSSGACNLFQEYPCGKWGGYGVDAHIQGADRYAKERYGGWWSAWSEWQAKNWW